MQGCAGNKIDNQATNGLLGVSNSLAYRVAEIERHIHSKEMWRGKLAIQTATNWCDNNINTPFVAISGNNAYGTDPNDEAQVIGTGDTPAAVGNVRFDIHRIFITDCSVTTVCKLRLVWGTGTMAAAEAADQFTSVMSRFDAAPGALLSVPVPIQMRRGTCGATKIWMRFWSLTNNATVSFYVGWHEYEG